MKFKKYKTMPKNSYLTPAGAIKDLQALDTDLQTIKEELSKAERRAKNATGTVKQSLLETIDSLRKLKEDREKDIKKLLAAHPGLERGDSEKTLVPEDDDEDGATSDSTITPEGSPPPKSPMPPPQQDEEEAQAAGYDHDDPDSTTTDEENPPPKPPMTWILTVATAAGDDGDNAGSDEDDTEATAATAAGTASMEPTAATNPPTLSLCGTLNEESTA
ncbi:MAG: hypothetical protein K0T99_02400 [Alphaproteobacteria bacterium]|nr:hypothetical protein [Alphaproteobacteria bacterium]